MISADMRMQLKGVLLWQQQGHGIKSTNPKKEY